jgi:hypothetical protein
MLLCCCLTGIVDADFPTSRINDDISQLLNPALQAAADSILYASRQLAADGDGNLNTYPRAALNPMPSMSAAESAATPQLVRGLSRLL